MSEVISREVASLCRMFMAGSHSRKPKTKNLILFSFSQYVIFLFLYALMRDEAASAVMGLRCAVF